MIGDTGCCGFRLNRDRVTFLGLLTLSLPVVIFCAGLNPVLYIIGKISPRAENGRERIAAIRAANIRLINKANLNSKFRCRITGGIFLYSPRLAGVIYRHFNISLLLLFWAGIISCVYLAGVITD